MILYLWKRNKVFLRKTKAKEIYHHKICMVQKGNIEKSSYTWNKITKKAQYFE